jgi:hypothetical protein
MTPMGTSQFAWLFILIGSRLYVTAAAYLLSHVADAWEGLTFQVFVVECLARWLLQKRRANRKKLKKLKERVKAPEERLAPE